MALEMPVGMSVRAAPSTHGLTTRHWGFGTVIAVSSPLAAAAVACCEDWDAIPDVPRDGRQAVPIATAVARRAMVAACSILVHVAGYWVAVVEPVAVVPSFPVSRLTAVVAATVVADSDSPIAVADAMVAAELVLPIMAVDAMTRAVAQVIGTVWICWADCVPASDAEDAACSRESERVVVATRVPAPVVDATSPEPDLRSLGIVIHQIDIEKALSNGDKAFFR